MDVQSTPHGAGEQEPQRSLHPPVQAVALRYDQGKDTAPIVVAGGTGALAERMIQLAREAGIPLVEDPDLVRWLIRVPVGTEVPPMLYEAVARVFAFLLQAEAQVRGAAGAKTAGERGDGEWDAGLSDSTEKNWQRATS